MMNFTNKIVGHSSMGLGSCSGSYWFAACNVLTEKKGCDAVYTLYNVSPIFFSLSFKIFQFFGGHVNRFASGKFHCWSTNGCTKGITKLFKPSQGFLPRKVAHVCTLELSLCKRTFLMTQSTLFFRLLIALPFQSQSVCKLLHARH